MDKKNSKNATIDDFYPRFFQIREGMTIAEVAKLITDAHMENCSYSDEPDGQTSWTFYKMGWHTGYVIIFKDKKVIRIHDDKKLDPERNKG